MGYKPTYHWGCITLYKLLNPCNCLERIHYITTLYLAPTWCSFLGYSTFCIGTTYITCTNAVLS